MKIKRAKHGKKAKQGKSKPKKKKKKKAFKLRGVGGGTAKPSDTKGESQTVPNVNCTTKWPSRAGVRALVFRRCATPSVLVVRRRYHQSTTHHNCACAICPAPGPSIL